MGLCGDSEPGNVGTTARVAASLEERSAHCAHTAISYLLQSRVDYVLSVHLPSQTRRLAAAVDGALREAYAQALGADILNPGGDFPKQLDPASPRVRGLQAHGGVHTVPLLPLQSSTSHLGLRITSAALAIPGAHSRGRSVNEKDSKQEKQCWEAFFASGCRMAREMEEETARIRRLRDESLGSIGISANPPQSAVFYRPDEGLGYRIDNAQKRALGEIKGLRAKGLERRAGNLPPAVLQADQRRMALLLSTNGRFETRSAGAPFRSSPISNGEFRVAALSRFGVPLTYLKPFMNQPLRSNASTPGKFNGAFGINTKNLWGAGGGGTTETAARS